ncbi:MAG: hypothetical protein LEGION0403_FIIPPAGN_00877 [Legionella sp.]|uniref:hypothetical protein n=1 Tax=Legionella sp. TaxID=459 RepID=UPI003D11D918
MVRSLNHARKQEQRLHEHIKEAQAAIAKLNQRGRGIKILDEKELLAAVDTILKKYKLQSLLQIEYRKEEKKTLHKATHKREAYILVETSITVHSTLNQDALEQYVRNLGWRVRHYRSIKSVSQYALFLIREHCAKHASKLNIW